MGIIDDYLKADADKAAAPTPAAEVKGDSLIDQYLAAPDDKPKIRVVITPKPPISGVSKEASDDINAQPSKEGGANPRDGIVEGIKNFLPNTGADIATNFKGAAGEVGSGLSDITSNQPASGVGKVGMGVLGGLTAIPSAVIDNTISKPVTELTGNPRAGDAAGLVAGGLLPVSGTAKAVVAAKPTNKALRTLVESIGIDKLPDVVKQMKENPRLTPADLSPKVKQDVQSLFVTDGPHINYLSNTVDQRLASAKGAVEDAMNGHLGAPVDAVQKLGELKQNIRDVGKNQINPAVAGAKPVDLTDTIAHIDNQIKPGVNSVISSGQLPSTEINRQLGVVRKILTDDKSVRTDANSLHDIQSVLRKEGEGLLNSADGQARRMGSAIMGVRNKIVDAIDDASGGKYKPALKGYRDEFHIQDAFDHGHDAIISNSKAIESRPEFFKDWVSKASDKELEAAREGARVAIDTQINGFKHAARRGTDVGEVDFNRQRIEALFGKEEADKLFKKLKDERAIADTNNKIVQGSQTAMRMGSKEKFALPEKGKLTNIAPYAAEAVGALTTGLPGVGAAIYSGLKLANSGKDAIAMKLARNHNGAYAKYALPTDGESRNQLIQSLDAIANRPPKQSLIRRGAGTLSRLVAP